MIGTLTLGSTQVRRIAALVVALAVMLLPLTATSAKAEPNYPPSFDGISASKTCAKVGTKIRFRAMTFEPGSTVMYDVAGPMVKSGSVTANGSGKALKTIRFTKVGDYTVTFSGTGDDGEPLVLSIDVTIVKKARQCSGSEDSRSGSGSGGGGSGSVAPANESNDPASQSNDPAVAAKSDESSGAAFFGGLPRTGGEIALTVLVGVALLGGGIGVVLATRNRRSTTSS